MTTTHTLRGTGWKLAAATGLVLLTAACGSTSTSAGSGGTSTAAASTAAASTAASASGQLLQVAQTSLGSILETGTGQTVYMFAIDTTGVSNCNGTCLKYWPIVAAPATIPQVPGVTATLGSIKRSDGTTQLTVGGRPVYTFAGDATPGATSGQGKNTSGGLWYVLSPAGAIITAAPAGNASPSPSSSKSKSSGGGYGY